ncbi:PilZ domain-containing protein [Paenibacillus abyssi]|uniref:PilZ domain-containing protein n=1 Tax=Paenibacillus abyssi TaxID=1340531 RepID=A0A917CR12_9BACL|nr:PilZ domain-containing protein [Paenibacillus abyssi]GGF95689.1 hypothetical protein GCM10010916_11230 [Paenibacillus abyssi]
MKKIRLLHNEEQQELGLICLSGELMEAVAFTACSMEVGDVVTCHIDERYYECRLIRVTGEHLFFFVPSTQFIEEDTACLPSKIKSQMSGTLISKDTIIAAEVVDLSSQGIGFISSRHELQIAQTYFILLEFNANSLFFQIIIMNRNDETGRYGALIDYIEPAERKKFNQLIFQALLTP